MGKRRLRLAPDIVSYKKKKTSNNNSSNPFRSTKKKETNQFEAKRSSFQDKRYDTNFERALKKKISGEEKALLRFQKQRSKVSRRNFSLEEGEKVTLTHRGVELSGGMNGYGDIELSDDDDDFDLEDLQKMEPVGFDVIRAKAGIPKPGQPRTAKQNMQELVMKSKYVKEIARKEKEQLHGEIDVLDTNFGEIEAGLMDFSKKKNGPRNDWDDYDILVRNLRKETLHNPTNRLKTPEERAKEELKYLEALEQGRLRRMKESQKGDMGITNWDEDAEEEKTNIDMNLEKAKQKSLRVLKNNFKNVEFVLDVPDSVEDLFELLAGRTAQQQIDIIQRIRKSNHVSLDPENNKDKMQQFLVLILAYFKALCNMGEIDFSDLDVLSRAAFAISHDCPVMSAGIAKANLLNIQERINVTNSIPSGYTLLYLKLLTNIFPMSDFQHPVASSIMLILGASLTHCVIQTKHDICCGLFLCTLVLNCIKENKNYVPEIMEFIEGLLVAGFKKDEEFISDEFMLMKHENATFWKFQPGANLWKSFSKESKGGVKLSISNLYSEETKENCEIGCFMSVLLIIKEMIKCWSTYSTFQETSNKLLALLQIEKIKSNVPDRCLPLYLETLKELENTFSLQRMPMFVRPKPYHIKVLNPVLDPEFFPTEVDQKEKNEYHCKKIMKSEKKKEKKRKKEQLRSLRNDSHQMSSQKRLEKDDDARRRKEVQKQLWTFQEQLQADTNVMEKHKRNDKRND